VDNFVWESTKPFKGDNISKIRSFSKVLREEESIYTDAYHDVDAGAKRYKFNFKGILVQGFFIPDKRFFLEYVKVTTPGFILAGGLKVGSSR